MTGNLSHYCEVCFVLGLLEIKDPERALHLNAPLSCTFVQERGLRISASFYGPDEILLVSHPLLALKTWPQIKCIIGQAAIVLE